MMPTLDDYSLMILRLFGPRVMKAILKLNGLCYCDQCRDKLRELYYALCEQRKEAFDIAKDVSQ